MSPSSYSSKQMAHTSYSSPFFEFMYREFLKLIFTKSVSSSSMSVLDKFCDHENDYQDETDAHYDKEGD